MSSYNLAIKHLRNQNMRIFEENKELFINTTIPDNKYTPENIKTRIKLRKRIVPMQGLKNISVSQLNNYGYIIIQKRTSTKLKLDLTIKDNPFYNGMQELTNVIIQYDDTLHRVRLVGENIYGSPTHYGTGNWKKVMRGRPRTLDPYKTTPTTILKTLKNSQIDADHNYYLLNGCLPKKQLIKEISEIPIIITADNEIVCIPKEDDVQKIVSTGSSGGGKSVMHSRILIQAYYKWNSKIIMLNDFMGQFHSRALPNQIGGIGIDHQLLGEGGCGIPVIQFYITAPQMNILEETQDINFKLSIPFKTFMENRKLFTDNIKDWDFQATGSYIDANKQLFCLCKNLEDIKAVYEANIDFGRKSTEAKTSMITKHMSKWKYIFQDGFLDISSGVTSKNWKLYKNNKLVYEGHPILCCLEANLVPNLVTQFAANTESFRNVITYYMQMIMQYQRMKPENSKTTIILEADEMATIYQQHAGMDIDIATKTFNKLANMGRFQNFGFLINIQSYLDLHNNVTNNITHLIVTKIGRNEEMNRICKDCGIEVADFKREFQNKKKFEVAIIPKNGSLIVYNMMGTKLTPKPMYIGTIIRPNCVTLAKSK
jgi:hypothetical protein